MGRRKYSVRFVIIISIITLIIITFSIIGYFTFSSWRESAENVVTTLGKDTNKEILNQIGNFIDTPLYINEANQNLIKNGVVDLQNKKEREMYFVGVLKSTKEDVYSFSYGTETGEYYGARRNEKNEIEIMENNSKTNGKSRYYSITNDLTAGKLTTETGKFDARTRDWYIAGKVQQQPVYSPIYKHFVMPDLAISAAYPIYDKKGILQGVLGTHIILSKINSFLKEITKDRTADVYIIEKSSGELVANSAGKLNLKDLGDNKIKRIKVGEINNQPIIESYENYKKNSLNSILIVTKEDRFHVTLTNYKKEGIDWLIITSIPESQFTTEIMKNIKITMLLSVFILIIAILISIKNIEKVLKPIYNLIDATEKFSKGDFSPRAKIYRNDEIGKLSSAFNSMAEQLDALINGLEERVKERSLDIIYLSYHDQLTGLYNRRYFDEELIRLDDKAKLPLTIVMADMNGLKLINDSLGHALGDELLKQAAEAMTKGSRENDIIARIGGDEFVILMPNTQDFEAELIIKRIKDVLLKTKVGSFDISLSFGYGTRKSKEEAIIQTFKIAEDYMYKEKLFQSPTMRSKTISTIVSGFHEKNINEEKHSSKVSALCKHMGEVMGLPKGDIEELKTVGFLHDIGKIAIEESILSKAEKLTTEEWNEIKRHPEVGYRILSTVNDMSEMAEYVLAHHERWDGSGYPKGLKGTEIPLQSRIIAIAEAYDVMTSARSYSNTLTEEIAIEELKINAGTQFDPEIVVVFIEKVLKL